MYISPKQWGKKKQTLHVVTRSRDIQSESKTHFRNTVFKILVCVIVINYTKHDIIIQQYTLCMPGYISFL